jgi:hypothetical protein
MLLYDKDLSKLIFYADVLSNQKWMIQCVKRAILSMFVCTATKTKPKARSVEHEYQRELAEETYHDA